MKQFVKGGKTIAPSVERPPVIKVQLRDKEDDQRNKVGDVAKKRKVWVPPGGKNIGSGTGTAGRPT